MSDAWEAFVASLDPVALEQERYRAPADEERPGSATDLGIRAAHRFMARDYWAAVRATRAEVRARIKAAQEAWVDEQVAARADAPPRPAVVPDDELDRRFAAHRARQAQQRAAAAAQTRGHAA